MSDRPTPETDAEAITPSGFEADDVPAEFARKLERERDELQKAVNGLCEHFKVSPANTTLLAVELLKIQRERDEAKEHLSAAKHFLSKYITERDEAREALREIWQSGDAFLPQVENETTNRWRKAAGWEETK